MPICRYVSHIEPGNWIGAVKLSNTSTTRVDVAREERLLNSVISRFNCFQRGLARVCCHQQITGPVLRQDELHAWLRGWSPPPPTSPSAVGRWAEVTHRRAQWEARWWPISHSHHAAVVNDNSNICCPGIGPLAQVTEHLCAFRIRMLWIVARIPLPWHEVLSVAWAAVSEEPG